MGIVKKIVLFFSCEPGGAEVLIPVIKLLKSQADYIVLVASYGFALDRFAAKHVDVIEVKPVLSDEFFLFTRFSPDILITSATSLPSRDMSEKNLWINAREKGIPSIAFLDQWQNYAIRFSGVQEDQRLSFLPDIINCIDEIGRTEMIQEGFPESLLLPMGHPYLSSLHSEMNKIERTLPFPVESSEQRVHLFVSEALQEHFGDSRGYNQYSVLKLLLSYIEDSDPDAVLILKLHPKDKRDCYEGIIKKSSLDIKIFANEYTPIECLVMADVVYGMSSIMLIEAYVLGKKVLSIQPNLKVEDPFVLTRQNVLHRITSKDDILSTTFDINSCQPLDIEFCEQKFIELLKRII